MYMYVVYFKLQWWRGPYNKKIPVNAEQTSTVIKAASEN